MAAFKPLYEQGHLAIVHAAGSPDSTRSHFDAQDYMESGTPGVKTTDDGWLNRALQAEDLRASSSTPRSAPWRSAPTSADPRRQNSRHRSQQREQLRRRRPRPCALAGRQRLRSQYGASGDRIFHSTGE